MSHRNPPGRRRKREEIPPEEAEAQILLTQLQERNLPVPDELVSYVAERELIRRGLVHKNLESILQIVNPSLLAFEHVPKMLSVAQRILERQLDRVLVLMPPRYFKSEVWSKLLTSAYLLRYQSALVALSSYTAHLAWEMSVAARGYYEQAGGILGDEESKEKWTTAGHGAMWAVGMGGTILGRGYHLGLVDDPINPVHAASVLYQRKFAHWWASTWLSRQQSHMGVGQRLAQIVLVMQRLGPSDPIDYLFRREVGEQVECAPEHWHVVIMDEIKSEEPLGRWNGPYGLPPTCTVEGDDRKPGVILAPSLFPAEAVKSAQTGAGPLAASAQRQQRPMRAEGMFWRSDWFLNTYEVLPADAYNGGTDWDTAYSQEMRNSATANVRSFRGPSPPGTPADQFVIYIDEVDWEWLEFPALVKKMRAALGPHYVEKKATGKSTVQVLKTYNIPAEEVPVSADKLARASAAQPIVANGRIYVRRGVIQKLLWGERQGLLRVTAEGLQMGGEGLDLNDAFVQAIHRHAKLHGGKPEFMLGGGSR